MAIAFGVACEQITVELKCGGRVNRVEPILLKYRLKQHQPPLIFALFQKHIKAAGADDITEYTINRSSLGYRHLGLGGCAVTTDVNRHPTKKMQEAHTFVVSILARFDEVLKASLDPSCYHPAVFVPNHP